MSIAQNHPICTLFSTILDEQVGVVWPCCVARQLQLTAELRPFPFAMLSMLRALDLEDGPAISRYEGTSPSALGALLHGRCG